MVQNKIAKASISFMKSEKPMHSGNKSIQGTKPNKNSGKNYKNQFLSQ